jgi:hypothetical protein
MSVKIKKDKPIPPNCTDADKLLSFIKSTKTNYKKNLRDDIKSVRISINEPSKFIKFNKWKKINIDDWSLDDCIGYYLNKYLEITHIEDCDFKNCIKNRSFIRAENTIGDCLDEFFNNDREELKRYIDFIIPWWISEESFVKELPSFYSIFTSKKRTFIKCFEASKVIKNKVLKKRKDNDSEFTQKDGWHDYLNKGE